MTASEDTNGMLSSVTSGSMLFDYDSRSHTKQHRPKVNVMRKEDALKLVPIL